MPRCDVFPIVIEDLNSSVGPVANEHPASFVHVDAVHRPEFAKRDIFVVPSWYPASHEADEETVLFRFSDRPVQKALGLWREETQTS